MTSIKITPVHNFGAKTFSEKNTDRTNDKIYDFKKSSNTEKQAHLKRIKSVLEAFMAANIDKKARAEFIHKKYRATENYFNGAVGNLFSDKLEEGGMNLNFGHLDNGIFTRSNDQAFNTVLCRIMEYAKAIIKEDNIKNTTADEIIALIYRIENGDHVTSDNCSVDLKLNNKKYESVGWAVVENDIQMRELEPRGFSKTDLDAYHKFADFFNRVMVPENDNAAMYEFFGNVVSHIRGRDVESGERLEASLKNQIIQTADKPEPYFLVVMTDLSTIKNNKYLSGIFCHEIENRLASIVDMRKKQASAHDELRNMGLSFVNDKKFTIVKFNNPATDEQDLTGVKFGVNLDIIDLDHEEIRDFFIELCSKIYEGVASIEEIKINNAMFHGVLPKDSKKIMFEDRQNIIDGIDVNQITVKLKKEILPEEFINVTMKLEGFANKKFKDRHVNRLKGDYVGVGQLKYVTVSLGDGTYDFRDDVKNFVDQNPNFFRDFVGLNRELVEYHEELTGRRLELPEISDFSEESKTIFLENLAAVMDLLDTRDLAAVKDKMLNFLFRKALNRSFKPSYIRSFTL
ncbi:hypothetical protein [Pandoraea oxalativorans]|uniref:Uncharacterized protein n=1 Tax=Pandoraea oxalativorans TaxID=573737 RepID=A0A0G3ICJ4_9BURK|nr:hypothetical protein [Pandoraea oxalativorans]AKK24937.1 hypothetical protein MB84_29640 [Pandoraea oxalativorans]